MIYIFLTVCILAVYLLTLRKENKIEITKTELIMTYTPRQIADYFLYIGKDDKTMTPMKLIKLVYIAHGWNLGLNDEKLIDEDIQAWKYGTVIPSLYDDFKKFRSDKIKDIPDSEPTSIHEDDKKFLNKVYDVYKKYNGLELSAKTHQPNTPWTITWEKLINGSGEVDFTIPTELIKNYYKQLASK
jgi:uncharacterized phage-associated protein